MKKSVIIRTHRSGYGVDQCYKTMTLKELQEHIEKLLAIYNEDTKIYVGNDLQSYGFYTYGEIRDSDFYEIDEEDNVENIEEKYW